MGQGYPNETPVKSNEELMTMLPGIPFTVRRLCPNCLPSHQDIYYRRLTPLPEGFNLLDTLMNNWFSQSNLLNEDFSLHSTYEDAVLGVNGWEICNYDDPGVGFPRDCGPKDAIGHQWNSYYYYNPVTDVHAFYYNPPTEAQPLTEEDILRKLYASTDGDNWNDNSNWLSGDHCNWLGVTCTNGVVTCKCNSHHYFVLYLVVIIL